MEPEATRIYRITHVDNVSWILDNGLYANSSDVRDPRFTPIGNAELIAKRKTRHVPWGPGGTLDDYIAFYFGKHSVMLYQIHTGQVPGVASSQRDVVYLVSSVGRVREVGARYVLTDRHAYVVNATFTDHLARLSDLDWPSIEGRDFKRDPNHPEKGERRMAEFLVHRHLPVTALLGIACYDDAVCMKLQQELARRNMSLFVAARRGWYF